jgi:hypothetical protein
MTDQQKIEEMLREARIPFRNHNNMDCKLKICGSVFSFSPLGELIDVE